jgi:hypothetical protein
MPVLNEEEAIEALAEGLLAPYNPLTFNAAKARRNARSYACRIFDLQVFHYSALPNYEPSWDGWIEREIVSTLTALVRHPELATFRGELELELWTTLHEHAETLRKAKLPSTESIAKPPVSLSDSVPPHDLKSKRAAARRAFVDPLLEAKGWSVLDWAKHSELAYHTAADYLEGLTTPYRSTRLKLANSLGVKLAELPQ